jgi:hypothetical protein
MGERLSGGQDERTATALVPAVPNRGQQGLGEYAQPDQSSTINEMGQQGWRLHSIFEQDKNTVMVFERMVPRP